MTPPPARQALSRGCTARTSALDDWLPEYEYEERHAIDVAARRDEIGRALRGVTLADVPVASALMALRGLPARLRGEGAGLSRDGALVDHVASLGVVLEDRPGLLVAGVAGRFWKLSGDLERFAGPDEFRAYEPDGSAKAVIDFVWADGRLETTTRVHVPDPAARRLFGRYWLVVRPFSGAIRLALLRAARRRAERL
ncbi:MAG: hypothetical protein ACXWYS_09020 [Gaiellaceae bacterium]